MADTPVRLLLRVSVKLFSLLGLGAVLYALFSSLGNNKPEEHPVAAAPLIQSLEEFAEDRAHRIEWGMGNLILVRRNEETLASLRKESESLLDPNSRHARQPENLSPLVRSVRPDLFIAFDRGTDLGCPLTWIAPGNREAPLQPWSGGFRDSCRGSWYDAAGRVFKGQQAGRNLDIPPYRFRSEDLLEIGPYGDNPIPAN